MGKNSISLANNLSPKFAETSEFMCRLCLPLRCLEDAKLDVSSVAASGDDDDDDDAKRFSTVSKLLLTAFTLGVRNFPP